MAPPNRLSIVLPIHPAPVALVGQSMMFRIPKRRPFSGRILWNWLCSTKIHHQRHHHQLDPRIHLTPIIHRIHRFHRHPPGRLHPWHHRHHHFRPGLESLEFLVGLVPHRHHRHPPGQPMMFRIPKQAVSKYKSLSSPTALDGTPEPVVHCVAVPPGPGGPCGPIGPSGPINDVPDPQTPAVFGPNIVELVVFNQKSPSDPSPAVGSTDPFNTDLPSIPVPTGIMVAFITLFSVFTVTFIW